MDTDRVVTVSVKVIANFVFSIDNLYNIGCWYDSEKLLNFNSTNRRELYEKWAFYVYATCTTRQILDYWR